MRRLLCVLFACMFLAEPLLLAAVRGHKSMYAAGTLAALKPGEMGRLETSDTGVIFNPEKGAAAVTIPYDTITAMDYGEHAGRRVGSAIAWGVTTLGIMALPILLSKKKRHYLTLYINNDPKVAAQERDKLAKDAKAAPKGDVAAFEINKHDYAGLVSILQAKTGVAVQQEAVKR
jgi:hypothetical protein